MQHPKTPDGRYFIVRGRLWRLSDPSLSESRRKLLTMQLMAARREVGAAKRAADRAAEQLARANVNSAKIALGERGAPWWTDGAPDYNRKLARNSPYADWFQSLPSTADGPSENERQAKDPTSNS